MKKIIQERLEQLEVRIEKLKDNHKKLHALHFPKDGSKGVYAKYEDARGEYFDATREERDRLKSIGLDDKAEDLWDAAPPSYTGSPEDMHINKSIRIIRMVRKEIYACEAYLVMMNDSHLHYTREKIRDILRDI